MHETTVMDTSATSRAGGHQDRKTGQFGMPNRTIRFPRRQQQLLVTGTSKGQQRMDPLLMNQEAVRGGQGRGTILRPMMK
jgi:hypothetical protein